VSIADDPPVSGGEGVWKKRAILALGAAAVVSGIAVPGPTWLAWLREIDPAEIPTAFSQGAMLLKASLVSLGLFTLVGGGLGWWRSDADANSPAPRSEPGRRSDLVIVVLLAVALGIRIYRLNDGFWYDEVLTLVNYVRLPLGELLMHFEDLNQHFLFSTLAKISVTAFGEHAWAMRFPATLFGVAGVWALYALAIRVVPRREALLCALLLCVSYHHVWFSQNARGYTGVLFFTLLSSELLLRGLENRQPKTWLAYGLALALGGFTHLTMLFTALTHFGIYLVWAFNARKEAGPALWHPLVSGFFFAGLFATTLYSLSLPGFFEAEAARTGGPIAAWQSPLWAIQEAIRSFHLELGVGALLGVAGLFVVAMGSVSFARQRPVIVVFFFALVLMILLFSLMTGHHLWPRSFFLAAGFGVMILVRAGLVAGEWIARVFGLGGVAGERIGVAGVLAVCALSASTLPFVYGPKQDFVGAQRQIEAELRTGDSVVTVGTAVFPYAEFYAPHWVATDSAEELQKVRDAHSRTWVVNIFPPYLEDRHADIAAMLDSDFALVEVFEGTLGGGGVYVYRSSDE
jgi:hypothetical protein